jgi:protein N-terminal amidase
MDLKYAPIPTIPILTNCSSPYKFEAPWNDWEFAYHVLHKQANLVILSMAWLTREDPRSYSRSPKDPDMETLSYWLARIEPLIRAETQGEIIVIFANRTGAEEEAVYTGTSAVLGVQAGEVKVYGILGRGEKELLVVDTSNRPQAKLVSAPDSTALDATKHFATGKSDHTTNAKATSLSPSEPSTRHLTVDETIPPLSPVDSIPHHAYFAAKSNEEENEPQYHSVKSSIGQTELSYQPSSPNFTRSESPKSGDANRTRQAEQQAPVPISHDEEKIIQKPSELRLPPYSTPIVASRQQRVANTTASPEDARKPPRPISTVW